MLIQKIKLTIKFFIYAFVSVLVKLVYKLPKARQGVLLIKADGIGDYILFRNFIPFYKSHFVNEPVTLLCNAASADLVNALDKKFFNNVIYLKISKYEKNVFFVFNFLKGIRQSGYNIVIQPTYSRSNTIDWISFVSSANKTVAFDGDLSNSTSCLRTVSKNIYTNIIVSEPKTLFEFDRNKEFLIKAFREPVYQTKTELKLIQNAIISLSEDYIVIFPGSSQVNTQWPLSHFIQLAKEILTVYDYTIVICGSKSEIQLGKEMVLQLTSPKVINLCGETSLTELINMISKAKLLVSNDTAAIHIAAAVDTTFICMSNGKHFGRYTPYPTSMDIKGIYIYPDNKFYDSGQFNILSEKYRYKSNYVLDQIDVNEVGIKIAKIIYDSNSTPLI